MAKNRREWAFRQPEPQIAVGNEPPAQLPDPGMILPDSGTPSPPSPAPPLSAVSIPLTTLGDDTLVAVTLQLPAKLVRGYTTQAETKGVSLPELLASRLTGCVSHTASKGIYLDDAHRQRAESMLGRNVNSADELVTLIRNTTSIKCEGIEIQLDPRLFRRLQSRLFRSSLEEVMEKCVRDGIRQYVGY